MKKTLTKIFIILWIFATSSYILYQEGKKQYFKIIENTSISIQQNMAISLFDLYEKCEPLKVIKEEKEIVFIPQDCIKK